MIGTAFLALGLVAGAWWFARVRTLPFRADATVAATSTVSVVVPARNEARSLPALLASLQASAAPPHEVIVVDDDSTDNTTEVAIANGATVVRLVGGPPPGWTGKSNACARGAAEATGQLLLFLDADVVVAADAVDRLRIAHARHGGLVSVQPHHRVERPYEELSATCNVVAMMGSGAFAPWPPPRPVGYGPCMLTSVTDYHRVGGHTAVRGDVVEDTALAGKYSACGLPVNAYAGGDVVSFRMYPEGVRQLVDGWTKSLAAGATHVSVGAVLASVWWVTSCLAFGLGGIDALLHAGSVDRVEAIVAASGWLAVTAELRWMLRRIGSFRWATAFLHPLPMWAFVALFGRSLWLTFVIRRVHWRGRDVLVGSGQTQ